LTCGCLVCFRSASEDTLERVVLSNSGSSCGHSSVFVDPIGHLGCPSVSVHLQLDFLMQGMVASGRLMLRGVVGVMHTTP
jgi:hypothetical protein